MPSLCRLALLLGLWLVPGVALAAPARPAPHGGGLASLNKELAEVRSQLAKLDSFLDQVKDLYVRLGRLQRVVDRLERAAQAPADLDRKVSRLQAALRRVRQRLEAVRLARARPASFASGGGGARAGYDHGFYVASADDRYRLTFNGVLRTWFAVGQVVGPAALRPEEPVDLVTFGLPTGIGMVDGHVFTKRLQYHIEFNLGGEGFELWDFRFHYRPCDYFGVTVGQFPVGYSDQQVMDPYDINFAYTSVGALMFGVGRDVGLKLHFYQWKDRLFEELALYNGGGMNTLKNDNIDLLYQFRAGIAPLGAVPTEEGDFRDGPRPLRFQIAAGYFFLPMPTGEDLDGKDGVDNMFVHQAAAELILVAKGFAINGEFFYRYEDRGEAVTQLIPPQKRRRHRFGGWAQASYYIRSIHLSLAAQYSYADSVAFWRRNAGAMVYGWSSPLGMRSDTERASEAPEAVHEVGAAVTFLAFDKHLKLMLDYHYLYEQGYTVLGRATHPSRQGHLVTLMTQARF